MSPQSGHRPRPLAAVTILLAILVAACGGTTVPSPAGSTTPIDTPAAPAATPVPSAADVSAAFFKSITSPDFMAVEKITGTVMVGANKGVLSGSGVMSGKDSSDTLTIKTGATSQVLSTISIGDLTWTRQDPGPWLVAPKPAKPTKDFGDFLRGIASFTDLGIETRDGRRFHHLQPGGGNAIPADTVGFGTGTGAQDAAFTVDFYATDDGTPAIVEMAGTWTIVSGDVDVPASLKFDDTLSGVGTPQTVTPPDDVWVRYSSKLGYTMAHPAGWKVTTGKDKDTYLRNGKPLVYVATTPFKGSTRSFTTALRTSYQRPFGGDPDSETARTLGGQDAWRLAYRFFTSSGGQAIVVDDVTVRAGTGWEVFVITTGGDDDVSTFNAFAATFAFAK
jgi:hypothetical protein